MSMSNNALSYLQECLEKATQEFISGKEAYASKTQELENCRRKVRDVLNALYVEITGETKGIS